MLTESEAIEIQSALQEEVITINNFNLPLKIIAGVDVEYDKNTDLIAGAVILLDSSTRSLLEIATHIMPSPFPYIPGLFSFREMPVIVEAYKKLKLKPDIIICDGHGIAHPRRFGLACHLGVTLNTPTIGCGKSLLCGTYSNLKEIRGSKADIVVEKEIIGSAIRTQTNINPIFVSIGHKVSLQTACDITLAMTSEYRLPETTRIADKYARESLIEYKLQHLQCNR